MCSLNFFSPDKILFVIMPCLALRHAYFSLLPPICKTLKSEGRVEYGLYVFPSLSKKAIILIYLFGWTVATLHFESKRSNALESAFRCYKTKSIALSIIWQLLGVSISNINQVFSAGFGLVLKQVGGCLGVTKLLIIACTHSRIHTHGPPSCIPPLYHHHPMVLIVN